MFWTCQMIGPGDKVLPINILIKIIVHETLPITSGFQIPDFHVIKIKIEWDTLFRKIRRLSLFRKVCFMTLISMLTKQYDIKRRNGTVNVVLAYLFWLRVWQKQIWAELSNTINNCTSWHRGSTPRASLTSHHKTYLSHTHRQAERYISFQYEFHL